MKVLTLIQARTGSTRLPSKVLMEVAPGVTVLDCVLAAAPHPHVLCIPATDKRLFEYALAKGENVACGTLVADDDVLGRFVKCAKDSLPPHESDWWILRLTGDCPMLTSEHTSKFVAKCALRISHIGPHYTIFTNRPWDPDGYDMELFSYAALKFAYTHARDPADREHVTPWMYRHLNVIRSSVLGRAPGPEFACEKVSVDTAEDLERVRRIYALRTPKVGPDA